MTVLQAPVLHVFVLQVTCLFFSPDNLLVLNLLQAQLKVDFYLLTGASPLALAKFIYYTDLQLVKIT